MAHQVAGPSAQPPPAHSGSRLRACVGEERGGRVAHQVAGSSAQPPPAYSGSRLHVLGEGPDMGPDLALMENRRDEKMEESVGGTGPLPSATMATRGEREKGSGRDPNPTPSSLKPGDRKRKDPSPHGRQGGGEKGVGRDPVSPNAPPRSPRHPASAAAAVRLRAVPAAAGCWPSDGPPFV